MRFKFAKSDQVTHVSAERIKVDRYADRPESRTPIGNLWFYGDVLKALRPDYETLHLQNLIVRIRYRKQKASVTFRKRLSLSSNLPNVVVRL